MGIDFTISQRIIPNSFTCLLVSSGQDGMRRNELGTVFVPASCLTS